MTVLVGLIHNGVAWLGADSSEFDGTLNVTDSPKVWLSGAFALGFTGSTREQNILQHRVELPEFDLEADDVRRWLVVDFADAIRAARTASGYERKDNGNETGPGLLIGHAGRLFDMYSDYAVSERFDYTVNGCGRGYARGSLHTSAKVWKSPHKRITAALEAACDADPYCAPPFTIVKTPCAL